MIILASNTQCKECKCEKAQHEIILKIPAEEIEITESIWCPVCKTKYYEANMELIEEEYRIKHTLTNIVVFN